MFMPTDTGTYADPAAAPFDAEADADSEVAELVRDFVGVALVERVELEDVKLLDGAAVMLAELDEAEVEVDFETVSEDIAARAPEPEDAEPVAIETLVEALVSERSSLITSTELPETVPTPFPEIECTPIAMSWHCPASLIS
jgi:hypothetical protein